MNFIKKYWLEILVIGVIFGVLLTCCAPDKTWINTDSDGIHYTYSSEWLYPSHKGSAPLYLLLGNLFLRIPIGTEFWRMALISVIAGTIASLFIMLIIKQKTGNKWYSIIGALIYGGSALAISQNTIVEAYPLVTCVALGVYFFCLKNKWLTASILIGVAGAIHPTSMLVIIPMLIAYKELRTWRRLGVMAIFVLFYLYVPITNRPPYMWESANSTGGILGFVKDSIDTAIMLTGKLAIYDVPKRVFDTIGLVLLNVAIIGIIPLIYAFKNGKGWYKNVLFWMVAIPTIYYFGDIAPQTYVYMQPSIAFGAIAIGIGLSKMNKKWITVATASCAVILLSFNANYFDIGRTLDPNLSATEYYEVELDKVPDGQILMPYYGWEWAAIYRYNKENNRNIIPVCIDTLSSPTYQQMMMEMGVKFGDNNDKDRLIRQNYIALSVVDLNENVWTTLTTDDKTYGCKVVLAKGNDEFVQKISLIIPAGQWHWKPTNPYGIITGSVEISEWKFITMSNHNVLYISLVIMIVYLLVKMAERMMVKKKVDAKS